MVTWIEPELDWDTPSAPGLADFKRIEGNEQYLYDRITTEETDRTAAIASESAARIASVSAESAARIAADGLNSSGEYTPSITPEANCSSPILQKAYYAKIGNVVMVSGVFLLNVAAGYTTTSAIVSIPIASTLSASSALFGKCGNYLNSGLGVVYKAPSTANAMRIVFNPGSFYGAIQIHFDCSYLITS